MAGFIEQGSGERGYVILPGLGFRKERYSALAAELARGGKRVVVLDFPGIGDVPMNKIFDIEDYLSFTLAFLNNLRMNKPVIIGHSLGGSTAISLASKNPDLLGGLVLSGSGGLKKEVYDNVLTYLNALKPRRIIELVKPTLNLNSPRSGIFYALHILLGKTTPFLEDSLAKITSPTLLVWGKNDKAFPPRYAHQMLGKIDGAELVIIAGTDHNLPFDKPIEMANQIKKFTASQNL